MGLIIRTTVDTHSLPADEAASLEQMAAQAHFFELPEMLENDGGADQFVYKLTIETEGQRHTVQTTDTAAPQELQPLLDQLTTLARQNPQRDNFAEDVAADEG